MGEQYQIKTGAKAWKAFAPVFIRRRAPRSPPVRGAHGISFEIRIRRPAGRAAEEYPVEAMLPPGIPLILMRTEQSWKP